MPSRRQERVAKRIMQELAEALRNLKHTQLGFVTITQCDISPDLRHAKVLVSVWGDDEEQQRTLGVLKHNASRLKGMIGRPLGTKVIPDLHFEFDESIANADRMSRLIRDARLTDSNPNPLTPEEQEALAGRTGDSTAGKFRRSDDCDVDVFETARHDVEEELFGDDLNDDPDWRPINLDELPDDEHEDGEEDDS